MIKELNCVGMECPYPVIETQKILKRAKNLKELTVIVDNEIARENLETFAAFHGLKSRVQREQDTIRVVLVCDEEKRNERSLAEIKEPLTKDELRPTYVFSSDTMGEGDPTLGHTLLKALLFSLTQADVLPERLIFYNRGVFLLCDEGEILDDLRTLEQAGCDLWACGTCLEFYELEAQRKIGNVTNMYGIVEAFHNAAKLITI